MHRTLYIILLIIIPFTLKSQFLIHEPFNSNTAPGFVLGGNPSAYLTGNELRLTEDKNDKRGYVYYDDFSFTGSDYIEIEFEYFTYGDSHVGADGICFFIFDEKFDFEVGGFGGSLGYAQRFENEPGMKGAYLGIGLDEFGNFSNPSENRNGGPGRIRNSVTIRGPESENYNFIHTVDVKSLYDFTIYSNEKATIESDTNYRKVFIKLSPLTIGYSITVDIQRGDSVYNIINELEYTYKAPSSYKIGISSSTGGSRNYHEISNLIIYSKANFLPVKLTDFTAVYDGTYVHLNWKTHVEINNDYFTVQRADSTMNFSDVGTVYGHGNSNRIIKYNFNDYDYDKSEPYYRLIQTDFDGSYEISDTIYVSIRDNVIELTISPNPVNDIINISSERIIGLIIIYDKSGNNLYNRYINDKYIKLDLSFLSNGMYFLHHESKIFKLIKK